MKYVLCYLLMFNAVFTTMPHQLTAVAAPESTTEDVAVTNKPIEVDIVDEKKQTVVRSFTLKENKVVTLKMPMSQLGTPITIHHKRQLAGKIFVTKATNFTYSNRVKTITTAQKKKLDQREIKWRQNLTKNQAVSLKDYASSGFMAINGSLRGIEKPTPYTDNRIKAIDHALAKFQNPYAVTLWRGTKLKTFKYGLEKGKLHIGARYSDQGYLSTSLIKEGILGFGTNAVVKVQLPKGNYAAPLYKISDYENEQEMLLKRGTKFIVTGIEKKNGQTLITINVLNQY